MATGLPCQYPTLHGMLTLCVACTPGTASTTLARLWSDGHGNPPDASELMRSDRDAQAKTPTLAASTST